MMAAVLKLQYLILIGVLHSRFSYGFPHELSYNGAKIVTYGEPCHPPRYLPVKIEEPVNPVVEIESAKSCLYQPLKLNYRVNSDELPIAYQPPAEYPISIQVPEVPKSPLEVITPDPLRGRSYAYNIQTPPPPPMPSVSTSYDFDLQIPVPPSFPEVSTPKTIKYLTGLNSRIDKILIPACEAPSCNCNA